MDDDRISWFFRCCRTRQSPTLYAITREVGSILIGNLGLGQTLQANTKARFVHHDEHGAHAFVFFTDKPTCCAVIVHDAGRVAVNAHFLFQAAAGHAVTVAQRAIFLHHVFRHHEQGNALNAFRSAFDTRQNKVNDVFSQVLLTTGNPDFLTGDFVRAIFLWNGFRLDEAEIGTTLWFGQVHRARPAAIDHARHIGLLLLFRATCQQRLICTMRQARIHGERHIGGTLHLVDGDVDDIWQALTAILRIGRQRQPFTLDQLVISFLEAIRRFHGCVGIANAALFVTDFIQRKQNFFSEFRTGFEDLVDDIARGVREAWQIGVVFDGQHIMKQELHIPNGRCVARHSVSPEL